MLTTEQLVALGLSRAAVSKRAVEGRLFRIHRGVYTLTPLSLVRPLGLMEAAVLAYGPHAALSLQSAAFAHGLIGHNAATPHITVARDGAVARRPHIHAHSSKTLRLDVDVTRVYGIRTTTISRTIFDLAGTLGSEQLERLLDEALTADLFDLHGLYEQIEHNRGRTANCRALIQALASDQIGSNVTWNMFEGRFRVLARTYDLPAPEVQHYLDLGDGEQPIRPDFLWRGARLIIETDGYGPHSSRHSFESDRRRDQRAAAAGYQTLRVTWRQLVAEAPRLGATLQPLTRRGNRVAV